MAMEETIHRLSMLPDPLQKAPLVSLLRHFLFASPASLGRRKTPEMLDKTLGMCKNAEQNAGNCGSCPMFLASIAFPASQPFA